MRTFCAFFFSPRAPPRQFAFRAARSFHTGSPCPSIAGASRPAPPARHAHRRHVASNSSHVFMRAASCSMFGIEHGIFAGAANSAPGIVELDRRGVHPSSQRLAGMDQIFQPPRIARSKTASAGPAGRRRFRRYVRRASSINSCFGSCVEVAFKAPRSLHPSVPARRFWDWFCRNSIWSGASLVSPARLSAIVRATHGSFPDMLPARRPPARTNRAARAGSSQLATAAVRLGP